MGPCKLLDLVGAEIAIHVMETMERDFENGYKPHPLLKRKYWRGYWGKRPAVDSMNIRLLYYLFKMGDIISERC